MRLRHACTFRCTKCLSTRPKHPRSKPEGSLRLGHDYTPSNAQYNHCSPAAIPSPPKSHHANSSALKAGDLPRGKLVSPWSTDRRHAAPYDTTGVENRETDWAPAVLLFTHHLHRCPIRNRQPLHGAVEHDRHDKPFSLTGCCRGYFSKTPLGSVTNRRRKRIGP